ncbi:hypothetical protein COLO4_05794 [Corchorus olitorius]|uniref:Protein DEFECTIVE KERNEL 1 n=1 Tax=Corchorus olitorius TaxID=93759 RepID=A0A1R3KPV0_9ROSI|nr:hypothetical protein COLO4_05794 [Corchorus olitorius]
MERDGVALACVISGTLFAVLGSASFAILWAVNWRPWRIYSWIFARKWPRILQGPQLAGSSASERYSPSGFFFGVSAIALAINMLFICRMVFNGNGLDVDEYVRRAYKFAYSDSIEMGPMSCLPEPPDPNELYPREFSRASHLGLLYLGSLAVLLVYSILYGLTAKDAHWLGAITSAAVIILDWNMGACLYGFQLLKSRVAALFVAGSSRVFLICFGVHYWYLGHCVSYAVVASVLLGAAVSRHFSATNPLAARRDALQSTVIRLREGFRRKEQNSSSGSSDGCGSSVKRSSSVEAGHLTNIIEDSSKSIVQCSADANNWNNLVMYPTASVQDGINSDKSMDSGRPSLALHSSSHRKSSVLLGLSLTVPLMVACLSFAIPVWIRNGYQFWVPQVQCAGHAGNSRPPGTKEVVVLTLCITVFTGSVIALGAIVSAKPLEDLGYKGWTGEEKTFTSPYASSAYIGWAMASAVALAVTGVLPIISWFATYRKDDDWKLSRGVYVFVTIGLLLLLSAISAVIVVIKPWTIGAAFLLVLLLIVLAIGVIHHWASNNFYLTRTQMFLVCFLAFLLGLAAFFVGWFQEKPFVGASVGYFSFLFLIAGRALTVLLSPPIVVYSPRVLPVYVYDSHADCGKNVSAAFLVLYGIALATEGWGVVASLKIYPPFAGAAVSAVTLVVAFGFAVSRPCLTLKMMEDSVHFLSKDTVVQAISRSATKTRNALSGTYSAPQRSASSAALLVGDPAATLDKGGNFVLPRDDVMKLRDRLRNEELVAGPFFRRMRYRRRFHHEPPTDVDYRREMCAHARILALEEAIDTEWVYMWDKFGGYLLLLLGLTAKAERVQDEVRLNLFLDSIGFSDLSAKKIKKWMPEDRRRFEIIQESYIREKEMEEEILMQRREEEGRGKERRKALLEKEERKWKEIEASLISSIPNAGSREAAAMAAAVRAVGGDSVLEDSFARERVSSIARRIRTAQLARRALQTGITGAVCILDDEPTTSGRHYGQIDPSMCQSQKVSFSIAVMIQPESGPVCLLGTEFQKKVCWEILVAGAEQGIEAGQVGLRLITKGDRQTTVAKEWSISATSIADGRWHIITMTVDADIGEASCFLDGGFDGYQTGLPLSVGNSIWEQGTEVWIGVRPPIDMDAFGRSDSEGAESKMHIMDVFLWGRCLNEDEIASLYAAISSSEFNLIDFPEDNWHWEDSPPRVDGWDSDPADVDLYDRDDVDWDGQYSSGRKRRSERDSFVVHVDSFARRFRKPRIETQEEINQRMLSVELAVKEALSARGELHFTDGEFPPNDQSLFVDPENPPSKLQVVSEWMRPAEIVKEGRLDSRPCLFSGAANPSDVCQGRLGDCWFLSAVAVLTEVSRISEVIITPEYNEEGIYTVRFCIQGEWVPVVVDDWIPCESPGKPAFATSRKGNELWVSILEKAYAKLHGSYEALEGGLVQDALVDLTGGAGEEIDMRSPQAQIDLASGRLWSQLLRFKQEGFLLGAGSPSELLRGDRSYPIVIQVREVDGHKLVQIRNPWANEVEWNGPWSDSSSEWTDRMRHKLKHVPQSKDGIFWMSWQDFQIHFRSIYVCRVYPPEMRYSVHGQWRGYSAGGCQDYNSWHQNPQFRLRATGPDASYPIHVFITLTQGVSFSRTVAGFRNYQSSHDSMMFYIGMRILKTRGRRAAYNIYLHESVGGTGSTGLSAAKMACELAVHMTTTSIMSSHSQFGRCRSYMSQNAFIYARGLIVITLIRFGDSLNLYFLDLSLQRIEEGSRGGLTVHL